MSCRWTYNIISISSFQAALEGDQGSQVEEPEFTSFHGHTSYSYLHSRYENNPKTKDTHIYMYICVWSVCVCIMEDNMRKYIHIYIYIHRVFVLPNQTWIYSLTHNTHTHTYIFFSFYLPSRSTPILSLFLKSGRIMTKMMYCFYSFVFHTDVHLVNYSLNHSVYEYFKISTN